MRRLTVNLFSASVALVAAAASSKSKRPASTFAVGLVIASAMEYGYHKLALHGKKSTRLRLDHLNHHSEFADGRQAEMDDIERQNQTLEHPVVFPVAFTALWGLFRIVGKVPRELMAAWTLHYAAFELSHWGCHVRNNPIDRILLRLPIVGDIRARQIRYHLQHHKRPDTNFAFLPPYTPDRVLGTRREASA